VTGQTHWSLAQIATTFFAANAQIGIKSCPDVFHDFLIEQRVGKEIRISTLSAQIVKIEEGPAETRVLIRPDPKVRALKSLRY
jgi:hypothetical protein